MLAAVATTALAQNRLGIILIGDAGEPGGILDSNARLMEEWSRPERNGGADVGLLFFLGDNFYPIGLNNDSATNQRLIEECLGPHQRLLAQLGRNNVHAMAGNHDYYCNMLGPAPYGACIQGNRRESEIAEWSYHYRYPSLVRRATQQGGSDSVDVIIFDSALLLNQRQETWREALDSLEQLLRASAAAPGVRWRILTAHHSPYSVGEHAGYRRWSERQGAVVHFGNCWEDGVDPTKYVQQLVSNEDNCTPHYRAYSDSLGAVIARSGARIHAMIAGHDHSLQLLNSPSAERSGSASVRPFGPHLYVISGAGAKASRVRSPAPPNIFTSPKNTRADQGTSQAGFTLCTFGARGLEIRFIGADEGRVLSMGGKSGTFIVNESGQLVGD